MATTIIFEKKSVEKYLDERIEHWSKIRDSDKTMRTGAECYIDAFQSIKISLFGESWERLEKEGK